MNIRQLNTFHSIALMIGPQPVIELVSHALQNAIDTCGPLTNAGDMTPKHGKVYLASVIDLLSAPDCSPIARCWLSDQGITA